LLSAEGRDATAVGATPSEEPEAPLDGERSAPSGAERVVAPPLETVVLQTNASGEVVGGLPVGRARRSLVIETWVVMFAFLLPSVMAAVILLSQHIAGVVDISRFPSIVRHQPVTNLILGILAYLPVAATVPLAFYLLGRTGQDRKTLGIGVPSFKRDVLPGLGIGAAAFGSEIVLLTPLLLILGSNNSLLVTVSTSSVPKYYIIWGVAISAVTAVTEEMLVNGYLLTRLAQLGWTPRKSLILSLILRTSYHIYYGLGFLLTVPFGYFVTRSFQKHHRLNRPIVAHFLFDAILITIAILR
jgi:membrane protease YdiL (CAAX protease family)